MGDTINYTININGDASSVLDKIGANANKASDKINSLRNKLSKFGDALFTLNNISYAFDGISRAINSAIQPGASYNSSLLDLSAIAGVTGDNLDKIGDYARKNAKLFGGDAAQSLESYKLILSKLSPEIANVPEALRMMGKSVSINSKTMRGDITASAEVLTTAMNQFQVSLTDPMQAANTMNEMMNIMAAAAKAGSAELLQIKEALEQSGMAAKTAGISFAETNAAIQVLDKAGKKGAEGGVALRNALSIMAEGRFMPKVTQDALKAAGIDIKKLGDKTLSFADRLKLLKPAMNDTALMTQVFGRENANAGIALLSGIGQIEDYTQAISGTNSAYEQAETIMGSYTEKMSRLHARFDDLKISFFNMTKSILPAMQVAFYGINIAAQSGVVINGIATLTETALAKSIANRTKNIYKAIAAQFQLNISGGFWTVTGGILIGINNLVAASFKAIGRAIYSIPIIGWIAAGVTLLIGVFKLLWDRSEKFRQILFGVWESVKAVFTNIGIVIKNIWENIVKPVFMFFYNVWKTVITGIISAAKWLWNGLVSIFTAVGQFINDYLIQPVWSAIMWVINGVSSLFGSIWSWISNTFSGLSNWLSDNLINPIADVFSKLWGFIKGILNNIIDALMKPIKLIKELWNKIFPKDQFKDINVAYNVGVEKGTQSWNNSKSQNAKIDPAAIPGMKSSDNGFDAPQSNVPGQNLSDNISSGGTRNSSITIQFKNMVESIVFDGNLKDKRSDLEKEVTSIMARVLAMAKSTA